MALLQTQFCSTAYPQNNIVGGDPINQLALADELTSPRNRRPPPIGRESSTCTQVIWIFFWLFVLIVFAYPIAIVAGIIYALTNPLSLFNCFQIPIKVLMSALNFPLTCAQNMVDAKQLIIM